MSLHSLNTRQRRGLHRTYHFLAYRIPRPLALDYRKSSPRICAAHNIYNENYWLPYSMTSIYTIVDQIIILIGEKPRYAPEAEQREILSGVTSLADPAE